jgi:hypothetical protein
MNCVYARYPELDAKHQIRRLYYDGIVGFGSVHVRPHFTAAHFVSVNLLHNANHLCAGSELFRLGLD